MAGFRKQCGYARFFTVQLCFRKFAEFRKQCGYARFAYNNALADFRCELDRDNFLSASELNKRFNVKKKEIAWVKDQDQVVANKSIFENLASAISNWANKRSHFLKFKKTWYKR